MESLVYERRTFYFELEAYGSGSYGYHYVTKFYKKIKDRVVKKYILFGPNVSIPQYEHVFSIDGDIKNPDYSKEKVKKLIGEKVKWLNRKEEIENGDLI